ncbi:MAG: hypothetical protein EAX96_06140 [Candidatus Lokiarchaeota archaeon]|nr:hypothetical protein [Candidatus Lokiarchaeota archaeon]
MEDVVEFNGEWKEEWKKEYLEIIQRIGGPFPEPTIFKEYEEQLKIVKKEIIEPIDREFRERDEKSIEG